MFRIKNIELKNFIGLRKINDTNGIFQLSIANDMNKEIIMIFGENGLGKTTLLENLTPYSNMLSRDVKDSVEYPAHKKITFVEDGTGREYRFEIYWEDKTHSKGFIYLNNEIIPATAKGNITEYNFEVEKMFGQFSKFKNSLFLQQGVLDIVKAKPSERVKTINAFMNELDIYNEIKENAVSKIEILKSKMEDFKEKIEELKTFENRYIDLKKFEEDFNYEEFEEEKSRLIEIEKKYLELSNRFSVKENIEKEIQKTEDTLNNFKNIDLEKQISEVGDMIAGLEKELENKEGAERLHAALLEINNSKNLVTNQLRDLGDISKDNAEKTYQAIEEELTETETLLKTLNSREEELRRTREGIQNYLNMRNILEGLEKEKSEILEEIQKLKGQEVKKPEEDFEEVYIKLGEIETEGKALRASKDEKDKTNAQLLELNKKIQEIQSEEKNLSEASERYQRLLVNEEEMAELRKTVENTDEEHKCQSCGQNVDIEILKAKIEKLQDEISKEDKKALLEAKNKLESNAKEIVRLERELELKTDSLKELDRDYETLLGETRNEYIRVNAIKEGILAYNKYFETVTPLENKTKDLDKRIGEMKAQMKEPEIGLEGLDTQIKGNKLDIEKTADRINSFRDDVKILSRYEIEKTTPVSEIVSEKEKWLGGAIRRESEIKKEYEAVNLKQKELKNLGDKKNFLNEENSKYKTVLLKSIELKETLKEYGEITKELVEETKKSYGVLKSTIEDKNIRLVEYKKDLELVNIKLEEYKKIKKDSEMAENELYLLSKIKNYSDRIKKASISEFFNSISAFINKIISSEKGTLSDMKLRISQKNNAKSFDILVDNGGVDVKDISLLSGAEQGTVARAIYFALAQFTNFGIIWLDECDGMLSETNKEVFIEMLIKMKEMIGLNQIFLISHNKNLIYKTDLVVDLNSKVEMV